MQRDYRLNTGLWGSLLIVSAIGLVGSSLAAVATVERWSKDLSAGIASSRQVAAYEREAREEIRRLEETSEVNRERVESIKDHTQSLVLDGYSCDPNEKPVFDSELWARPDTDVEVLDQDMKPIGYVAPTGLFIFDPRC